ncbi:MAG TPA: energy transducer TonB [Flavobacteriales bacterium]|jgi:protein TonB|nr:energy transducer TonB [Flavobacteriales bacterium]
MNSFWKNLNHRRPLFFLTGLVFALGLLLSAFEWRERFEFQGAEAGFIYENLLEDELPPLTYRKERKEIEKPIQKEIEPVVRDPEPLMNPILKNITPTVKTKPQISLSDSVFDFDPEMEEKDEIIQFPSKKPEYPGGLEAMYDFLNREMHYPQMARISGISGIVYVEFVVNTDGSIQEVKVKRGIGGGCDEEAMRVVKQMPKWIPGRQGIKKVRVRYVIPINFELRN